MTIKEATRGYGGAGGALGEDAIRQHTGQTAERGLDAGALPPCDTPAATVAAGRAAQELGLRRAEFELAVHLGLITVGSGPGGGRPRVHEKEIARLREQPGFPDDLAERVRTVGTAEGADLLGIAPARFTRLARAGCVSPVTFYLNRYRAVVWLYLADELAALALREPELLAGRTPLGMRSMLEAGADWRARNWRSQRIDRLLCRTDDAWARAAVQASALDAVQLAEVVEDPYERGYLVRVRPEPVFGRPASTAAREAMGELLLADDPDELLWRRVNLTLELDRAREDRPAPRPGDGARPRTTPVRVRSRAEAEAEAEAEAQTKAQAPVRVVAPPPAPARATAQTPTPTPPPGPARAVVTRRPCGRGLLARLGWRGRGAG
ncbi:DUF6397 family protein [Streptomyces sp. C11-1]|uniref:DUF6397 family protein n=1 Tax=Streptomyces durocortorensis TaxID=2811104 RepID=A0ABY9W7D2_9ACTN|nr:DUF6397 family protein [Streptomyces durocortorensis]WNF30981.1 DUF6397 family protein [Streptomyces durocortorensis]